MGVGIGWSTGGGGLRSKASVGTKREMEVRGCLTARALFAALPESVPQVRMKRWDEVCASRGRRRSGWCAYARKAPDGGLWGKGGRDNSALHRDGARAAKARSGLLTLESVAAGSGFDCVRIQTDAAAGVRISRRAPRASLLTLESVPLRAPPGGKGRLTFFCARQSLRSGTMRRPGAPPVLALPQV